MSHQPIGHSRPAPENLYGAEMYRCTRGRGRCDAAVARTTLDTWTAREPPSLGGARLWAVRPRPEGATANGAERDSNLQPIGVFRQQIGPTARGRAEARLIRGENLAISGFLTAFEVLPGGESDRTLDFRQGNAGSDPTRKSGGRPPHAHGDRARG